jgi:hypothetical protein
MNSWFRVLEAASPAAMTVLVIATVILLAAIVVHRTLRQSPARRHAVMLVALVAIGLCPVLVVVARLAGTVPWIPLPNPIAFDDLVSRSQSAVPFQGDDHVLSSGIQAF